MEESFSFSFFSFFQNPSFGCHHMHTQQTRLFTPDSLAIGSSAAGSAKSGMPRANWDAAVSVFTKAGECLRCVRAICASVSASELLTGSLNMHLARSGTATAGTP